MARNFSTVLSQIENVSNKKLNKKLDESIAFWAPETVWYGLTEFVNRYVRRSSRSSASIKIYAILCDCSEDEMKQQFEAEGH